jgi:hypothetical protein
MTLPLLNPSRRNRIGLGPFNMDTFLISDIFVTSCQPSLELLRRDAIFFSHRWWFGTVSRRTGTQSADS